MGLYCTVLYGTVLVCCCKTQHMILIFDAFISICFLIVRFRYGWLDYFRTATTARLRTRSNSRTLTPFFSLEIKALFFKRNARHDFPSASIAP
ncbi:hypothetical protein M431DRAFT_206568 [Trichoderma harzianum CBS 226.95]|uniref:Uncharacterized protein n=1 Tax=Trichoderma harzianum CBS 226.95 TaxID=983964 RepID=A0A2T4AVX8_TRIHA|nr:hypothetical protein M431DRAFT_206568 [Trichoderma harzianum CBS 226.95]PTB61227.1 hypothetical protein M431DRAFT_206568 [Trichoderma harzianum CBS 226.95]